MATHQMRVAKPDKRTIDSVHNFVHAAEAMLERQKFSLCDPCEEWTTWPDDDNDKQEMLRIRKRIAEEEGWSETDVDNRIVAYEYLLKKYSNRLQHVVISADIMIDNICDPTGDCLDFHPGFEFFHVAPEQ
jgi:hypothetical protein